MTGNGNAPFPNASNVDDSLGASSGGVPVNPSPTPTGNGEQNSGNGTPISNGSGSTNPNGGTGGSAMTGGTDTGSDPGTPGAAGSGSMPPPASPPDPEQPPPVTPPPPVNPPPPPSAPADPTPQEIAAFFAQLRCGAKYTALGDGGWAMCLRLADGGGACTNGSEAFTRVTFAGGAPVTNVAQISGMRDSQVSVVTTSGALHVGGMTSISTTPLIASGVVNVSGGYHASAALVEQGAGFGIRGWQDNGAPTTITLPNGAQPIQVSANYGVACALSTAGDVYCWNAGDNHGLGVGGTPTLMPITRAVQLISVGQNSVCGVSFDDTLECVAAWYDNPYLPTERVNNTTQTVLDDFRILPTTFPSVREVHSGFRQGIVVKGDGTAVFLGSASTPGDNPGEPFTGATDVIASGGDRGNACVQTRAGAVFCRVGSTVRRATLAGAPLTAQAAACPL